MSTEPATGADPIDPNDPVKPNWQWERGNTSWRECAAMRLLAADQGWSIDEIAMTFLATRNAIQHHVYGHCACRPETVLPLESDRP